MRFISKSSNLHVILKPGLPAEPLTGRPAQPTISVRFQDGIAEVRDEQLIELMIAHPGYQVDYISVDDGARDPYAATRSEIEPVHVLTDMRYGSPDKRTVSKQKPQLSPEMHAVVQSIAADMAKAMLPGLLKDALKDLAKATTEGGAKEAHKSSAEEKTGDEESESKDTLTKKK